MGWFGDFTYWNKRDTNKDIFLRVHPTIKQKIESGEYKISQSGSNVYLLGKGTDGKYWVDCYLCRREKGGEFMTKGIGALENHCFNFPKSWLPYLDSTEEVVKEYIRAREEYEAKQKSKTKIDFGDTIECTANYDISWSNSYKIGKGETARFVVQKLNPYARRVQKAYVLQVKRKHIDGSDYWYQTNCRLSASTFKHGVSDVKKVFV